jgi:glycosyltransferase involved in cell wall biosynthesis
MISVIVPVYNVENYIRKCVDSICNQTYKDLEIILVDDGSTDKSGKICDECKAKDNRIKVIHKENSGPSEARNMGLDIAKGEYISFIDSDDYICADMLEILLDSLNRTSSDIAMCDFACVYDGNEVQQSHDGKVVEKVYENDKMFDLLWDDNVRIVIQCNKLYMKKIFEKLRFPVGKINEDTYIAHRQMENCKRLVYVDKKLYYYRQHGGSIMSIVTEKRVNDTIDAYYDRINFFIGKDLQAYAERTKKSLIDDLLYFSEKQYVSKDCKIIKYINNRYRKLYLKYWKLLKEKKYLLFFIDYRLYMRYKRLR